MGRQPKKGLTYFPVDVDMFSDGKIEELIAKYSTDGFAIYLAILCIVYRHGYYFEAESEEGIVKAIKRELYDDRISRQRVLEVLHFCGVIRLLDSRLLCANVVTSAAIQSRYNEVTVRNKVDKSKYWLLPEGGGALEVIPENDISATEIAITATETPISATEMTPNKSKEKEITTTTIKPPSFSEVHGYFKHESLLPLSANTASETAKFIAYNANRRWDCLPDWKTAADLWAARVEEKGDQICK